ncbi:hypothetical protein F7018_03435 [Tenacibaculum aiptasiae]|uniref:Uncharacterized protein n=1 Tax=Tenacibaculum aiptasiae TaxID=426481 RepID=A0A7J5APA2_9FLAO|nr:hypothetical protein [Tenacibaculum aiptasiae]KAB1159377.1 hypothetical protein F7018_03435 [Tenacibaculum aiptasiae]
MDVIKLFLFIIPLLFFSQTKNNDAYYILDIDNPKYIITNSGGKEIQNVKNKKCLQSFLFYDRNSYEKEKQQIENDKKEKKFYNFQSYKIVETLSFSRQHNSKTTFINHSDIVFSKLKLVNYKWLIQNSWKENNPNILFKDLYFLLKVDRDKYLKFKVGRTLIAR